MGEQGAESIHAHMMKLDRVYHIPNDVDRLKYIFKERMLESTPSLTSLRPKPKRRKLKEREEESESEVSESEESEAESNTEL